MSDMERPTKLIEEFKSLSSDDAKWAQRNILIAWIEHLESELANAPRVIRADEVTTDHEIFADHQFLPVSSSKSACWEDQHITTDRLDKYELSPSISVIVRPKQGPVMPIEPTGDGYIYILVKLHNGAESIAKRSPNGHWWNGHWWGESMPPNGLVGITSGTWDDLLDYYGRTLPLTIVRLGPIDESES